MQRLKQEKTNNLSNQTHSNPITRMNKGFRKARHANLNKENNININNLDDQIQANFHLNFASLRRDNQNINTQSFSEIARNKYSKSKDNFFIQSDKMEDKSKEKFKENQLESVKRKLSFLQNQKGQNLNLFRNIAKKSCQKKRQSLEPSEKISQIILKSKRLEKEKSIKTFGLLKNKLIGKKQQDRTEQGFQEQDMVLNSRQISVDQSKVELDMHPTL